MHFVSPQTMPPAAGPFASMSPCPPSTSNTDLMHTVERPTSEDDEHKFIPLQQLELGYHMRLTFCWMIANRKSAFITLDVPVLYAARSCT